MAVTRIVANLDTPDPAALARFYLDLFFIRDPDGRLLNVLQHARD